MNDPDAGAAITELSVTSLPDCVCRDGRLIVRWSPDSEVAARRELVRQNWLFAYSDLFSREEVELLFSGQLRIRLSSSAERVTVIGTLVVLLGNTIEGLASLAGLSSGDAELTHLYVRVGSHGRGLGTALWNATVHELRSRGLPRVHVWTFQRGPAVRFYTSLGCTPAREGVALVGDHQEPMRELIYEL